MNWFYYFGRCIAWTGLRLLADWRTIGKENVPADGPLLVVANHISLADPPLISVSLQRKHVFMAKEELFSNHFTRYFLRRFGAFPVRRGGLNREAFKEAEYWLGRGVALVMFPEGGRSREVKLMPAYPGSVMIATRLNVPVLPIGITGTESFGHGFWWLRRPRMTANIGKVFSLPPVYGKLSKEERAKMAEYIMQHIAELLPPKYRGENGENQG